MGSGLSSTEGGVFPLTSLNNFKPRWEWFSDERYALSDAVQQTTEISNPQFYTNAITTCERAVKAVSSLLLSKPAAYAAVAAVIAGTVGGVIVWYKRTCAAMRYKDDRIALLEAENNELKEKIKSLSAQELVKENKVLTQDNSNLREDIERLSKDHLVADNKELEAIVRELHARNKELEYENNNLVDRVQRLEQEKSSLDTQVKANTNRMAQLEQLYLA